MHRFWITALTDVLFLLAVVGGSLILIAIFELLARWNRWRKVRFPGGRE